ncbi:MAG: hypothetical protein ABS85_00695 [Sphingobacteriales bacterium SCN 48-20]|nr:MAG: hypothetical protein ABS85_00695 [Sphingobacteriales bacterium SCN 48-20]OJW43323.1 MAG: hypothetical protein BGO56_06840 [Sphingobacteriales bacterium 48-107]
MFSREALTADPSLAERHETSANAATTTKMPTHLSLIAGYFENKIQRNGYPGNTLLYPFLSTEKIAASGYFRQLTIAIHSSRQYTLTTFILLK